MKKFMNVILIMVFTLSLPILAKADDGNRTRNSCDWNFGGWKYRAQARVAAFGWIKIDNSTGCPDAVYNAAESNNCAWQTAQNWIGAHSAAGAVTSNKRFCSRGNASSELYHDYFIREENNDEFHEYGEYSTARVQFNTHEVIMDSINIELQALGKNLFSSFAIAMWFPENAEDSIHTADNSFLRGKIKLINGEIIASGIFEDIPLRVAKNKDDIFVVKVENFMAKGVLPEGVTSNNTVIEVVTISDGGIEEEKEILEALDRSELNLKAYPNPSNGVLSIELKDVNTKNEYSISIYDNSGRTVSSIEENISSEKLQNYKIELSDYIKNKGVYYIVLISKSGNSKQMKKIIYK